jgi:tetratricopeptide (TPR) repeat protein
MRKPRTSIFTIDRRLIVCLLLVLSILAIYGKVRHYEFTNYDDIGYVTGNDRVKSGLTLKGLIWSFQTTAFYNWHPLTWISHMADVELYGMVAGGHHLANVFFHIANALLLFFLLRRMTDTLWRSAIVAALFALHPLHVESVAWVAERKDVLSTFFGILSLISYVRYTQQQSRSGYALALLFFILGLMAKPMLVTLPLLLLLLDYWPLGRLKFGKRLRLQPADGVSTVYFLLLEKAPFFLFTAASCAVTYYAQQSGGAMVTFDVYPLSIRAANAVVAYVGYIGKMLWPVQLAVFYPYPESFALWKVAAAAAVLSGISIGVMVQVKQRPYLAVGWFWYFGTLVPVIGLVQVGGQAMADRYTYVPLIGLFIMIVWSAAEIFDRGPVKRFIAALSAVVLMLTLSAVSYLQVAHWANSISLFSHAVKVTRNNYLAHLNLGKALHDAGQGLQAYQHYADALQIHPNLPQAHLNFGSGLLAQGKIGEAMNHFYRALQLDPGLAEAHNNLGLALVRIGNIEDSIHHFRRALKTNPKFKNAMINLNLATSINDNINRAVRRMRESLRIGALRADFNLKMIELSNRKRDVLNAVEKYRTALSKQPGFSGLDGSNPAAVAAVMQQYEDLLPLLLEKIRFQSTGAEAYYHVACIYARKGRFHESNKWLNRAMTRDRDRWHFFQTDPDLVGIQKSDSDFFKNADAVHFGADIFSKPSNEILRGLRII